MAMRCMSVMLLAAALAMLAGPPAVLLAGEGDSPKPPLPSAIHAAPTAKGRVEAAPTADKTPRPSAPKGPRAFDAPSQPASPTADNAARFRPAPGMTPEREAAVTAFVRRHHPELADLLAPLKENQPKEYAQAMRDLYRVTERLAQIHERDPAAYELELAAWKVKSRIQVLSARFKIAPSETLAEQLMAALLEEVDTRRALLAHDRLRLAERIDKLDVQLELIDNDRLRMAERQFEMLTRPENTAGTEPAPPTPRDKPLPVNAAGPGRGG